MGKPLLGDIASPKEHPSCWDGQGKVNGAQVNSSLRYPLALALLPLRSLPTYAGGLEQLLSILEKTVDDQGESKPGSSSPGCPGSPSTNPPAARRVHTFCKA